MRFGLAPGKSASRKGSYRYRGDLIDVQVLNEARVVIEARHTKLVGDDLT